MSIWVCFVLSHFAGTIIRALIIKKTLQSVENTLFAGWSNMLCFTRHYIVLLDISKYVFTGFQRADHVVKTLCYCDPCCNVVFMVKDTTSFLSWKSPTSFFFFFFLRQVKAGARVASQVKIRQPPLSTVGVVLTIWEYNMK